AAMAATDKEIVRLPSRACNTHIYVYVASIRHVILVCRETQSSVQWIHSPNHQSPNHPIIQNEKGFRGDRKPFFLALRRRLQLLNVLNRPRRVGYLFGFPVVAVQTAAMEHPP